MTEVVWYGIVWYGVSLASLQCRHGVCRGFHRSGRSSLHQARSTVTCSVEWAGGSKLSSGWGLKKQNQKGLSTAVGPNMRLCFAAAAAVAFILRLGRRYLVVETESSWVCSDLEAAYFRSGGLQ